MSRRSSAADLAIRRCRRIRARRTTTHSRVNCVRLPHQAEDQAFVEYSRAEQLIHVSWPDPAPFRPRWPNLRALDVCRHCHDRAPTWANTSTSVRRSTNDGTTPTRQLLRSRSEGKANGRAVHSRCDPSLKVEFVATGPNRRVGVEGGAAATPASPVVTRATQQFHPGGHLTVIDCLGLHNTTAHRIAPNREQADRSARSPASGSMGRPVRPHEALRLVREQTVHPEPVRHHRAPSTTSARRRPSSTTRAPINQAISVVDTRDIHR